MPEESFPCPYCEIGQCHLSHRTYLGIYNGMLLSAPQIPFWTCDICQHQEFDREAVERLESLLASDDGLKQRIADKITSSDTRKPPQVRRVKP